MTVDFTSKIQGGRLEAVISQRIASHLAMLNDKTVTITIETVDDTRSSQQNRYWWGFIVKPVQDKFYEQGTYMTKEEVHNFLKQKSPVTCKEVVIHETGEVMYYIRSSADLSIPEFNQLVKDIHIWCAENMDLVLKDPNER